jgi:DNA replication protein DnaC
MTDSAALASIGAATIELRLPVVRSDAARLAEVAQRSQSSYLGFLAEVLSAEVDERTERRRQRRVSDAHFPRKKRLADFDLAAAPSVSPASIATLAGGAFIGAGDPVVLLGGPGTGKSHLLIGLGVATCEQVKRVRSATCAQLVNELAEAADDRRLSRVVSRYGRLELLCLDLCRLGDYAERWARVTSGA